MNTAKVTISIDSRLLSQLDALVEAHQFPSRSQAIQEAIAEKLLHYRREQFEVECAKLEPAAEQSLADEGLADEVSQWPTY